MAHVTSVMITGTFSMEDEPHLFKHLNDYRQEENDFREIPVHFTAGSKRVQGNVLLGGFNYLDEAEFINHLKALKSLVPDYTYESMQLFMMDDDPESKWVEVGI